MNTLQRPSELPLPASGLTWPPGFTGAIAKYIYDGAQRPVPEVAIVAALGLLSGICGKSWTTSTRAGLNQYIILVARSAIGKEAMHSGISTLMRYATDDKQLVSARDFVDFSDFVSAPALTKGCAARPSFVNVISEFGHRLKSIATNTKTGSTEQGLRAQLTRLYSKSGPDGVAGGLSYSNRDNNISSMNGHAYSLIGETTPSTFFELLTPDMMEDGFMSRFCVVEYTGNRPPPNELATYFAKPWEGLLSAFRYLLAHSLYLLQTDTTISVAEDGDAQSMYRSFNAECDDHINSTRDDDAFRQMWNRAALKALKNASLLAVADNCVSPLMNAGHMQWAIDFVRRDIAIFAQHLANGDIGLNDDTREAKLQSIAHEFLYAGPLPSSFKKLEPLRGALFIPRTYLQIRTQKLSAFVNHRLGPTKALDETIASLIKSGIFAEAPKLPSGDRHGLVDYGYHGKAYLLIGNMSGSNIRRPNDWLNLPTLNGN